MSPDTRTACTRDPWLLDTSEEIRPSLRKRAEKRTGRWLSPRRWWVYGDPKLGDSYNDYTVTKSPTGRWFCTCQEHGGGEYRRRICSHIVWCQIQPAEDEVTGVEDVPVTTPAVIEEVPPPRLDLPLPGDPIFGPVAFPDWVGEFRSHQWDCAQEIVDAYRTGNELVFLDGPTGSGKTLIAEMVRRMFGAKAVYCCHGKTLQDQFLRDFDYAQVLKGRANYPTLFGGLDVNCGDCTAQSVDDMCLTGCHENVFGCPYRVAKRSAAGSRLAVLNTAYLLAEGNTERTVFGNRQFGLGIFDECLPAGSMVNTPSGLIAIERIIPGSFVWGRDDETGRLAATQVLAIGGRWAEKLTAVDGVVMTPNHPVWTERGYMPAEMVKTTDELTRLEYVNGDPYMRVVRPCLEGEGDDAEVLLGLPRQEGGACGGDLQEVGIRSSQPNPRPRGGSEGTREGGECSSDGGERDWADSPARDALGCAWPAMGGRTCHWHRTQASRLANQLQDRPGQPGVDAGHRGRRGVSSQPEDTGSRRPEGSVLAGTRLDHHAIQEPGDHGSVGDGSPAGVQVFNLRTSSGNFFVEGLLTHNCDTLEGELMSHVEVAITERRMRDLDVGAPKFVTKPETWAIWLREQVIPGVKRELKTLPRRTTNLQTLRRRQGWERLLDKLYVLESGVEDGNWVFDGYQRGGAIFKPIRVDEFGQAYLWRHFPKSLAMSATIVSPDELVESLGWEKPWKLVQAPMTFPVANRPIYVAPVANMTAKEKDTAWPQMANAISNVLERHEKSEKVLVHTVSYALADYLIRNVKSMRVMVTYKNAAEREYALSRYRQEPGAVIFAPSLDRGVDFKEDDCRVCIVAKVPYPNLGDRQVSARLHSRGGQLWFSVQAVRSLVQMTGRGVRSAEDKCTSYILDQQFVTNVYKKSKHLLPQWWKDALRMDFPVLDLRKEVR